MIEEASLKFRLRKSEEIRNYLLDEIKHNDLMGEKRKKTRKYLNFAESLLILSSIITYCVSLSAFASLVCVPSSSSEVGIKICGNTAGIKNYKSIIKKKKEKA